MNLTWAFLVLNSLSILSSSFCCVGLLHLPRTRPRLRTYETVFHVWLAACVLLACVLLASLGVISDVMDDDVSVAYCVALDSLLSGSLTLLALPLIVQSSLRSVLTFWPHAVPSDR